MQLSQRFEIGFWLILDCRFPDDPNFRISVFLYFRVLSFPVYVSPCIWPCRAGWIEGLFEVVALNNSLIQNETCTCPVWLIFWFSRKLWPLDSCFTELFSSNRDTVSPVWSFGLLTWDKNGRILAVSKAHLRDFYGVRHLRDWNMAQSVSQCQWWIR